MSRKIQTKRDAGKLLGPLFYEFCYRLHWLTGNYDRKQDALLFMSRGGLRLQYLYELFLDCNDLKSKIDLHPFWISRFAAVKLIFPVNPELAVSHVVREFSYTNCRTMAAALIPDQMFPDKNDLLLPCPRHFIGHLQTNKVKYLVGKVELFHSCDRDDIANEIARLSMQRGVVSNVLIQINIGDEESKGGYAFDSAKETYARLSQTQGLKVKGFMAMLPDTDDETLLRALARKMRGLFEWAKTQSSDVEYLSMGMSGDYALCISEGSNMIRVGSTIFGARDYSVK